MRSCSCGKPIVACIGCVGCLLPILYLGGYFALSEVHYTVPLKTKVRVYASEWLAAAYQPLARVEGDVLTAYYDGDLPSVLE